MERRKMQTLLALCPVLVSRIPRNSAFDPRNSYLLVRKYSEQSRKSNTPREVVRWMGEHAPVFAHCSDQISVLHEPTEFYETLKANISSAQQRIVLASLYLGTGPKERQLVDCIYDTVKKSSDSENPINVEILLECTRGSRGSTNSRTMLLPLLRQFNNSVKVSLYHAPELRGLLKMILPERFNETVALTHLKVYLTDDTVIMSGANLSHDYFTNRQDRYIEIRNCPNLADYLHNLVTVVRSFSFQLHSDNSTQMDVNFSAHPTKGWDKGKCFRTEASRRVREFLRESHEENKFKDPHPESIGNPDTWIIPLVQMYPFGIRQDEFVTSELLQSAPQGSKVHLASGYFNLTKNYVDVILKSSARYSILTAHPTANGFYCAGGVAGGVPDGYTLIARKFYNLVGKHNQKERIQLLEYMREQWTFHGKGLWYYFPEKNLPFLTLIGSPNFGHRSVHRDLEAQVAIVTENETFAEALYKEQEHLYSRASNVNDRTFEFEDRKAPIWVHLAVRLISSYL